MTKKALNLRDIAGQIKKYIANKQYEKPYSCRLEDGEYALASVFYKEDPKTKMADIPITVCLEIKDMDSFAGRTKVFTSFPIEAVNEEDWEEKCANALLRLRFRARYDDQWDFTHQMLNREETFEYFIRDTKKTYNGPHPIHIKDVPEQLREEYLKYLKQALAEHWGILVEEVESNYTLEDAIEESKDGLFELL